MTATRDTSFALASGLTVDDVEDGLAARFGIRAVDLPPEQAVYWDTFDARLGRADAALATLIHDGATHLVWESEAQELQQRARVRKPLGFVADLPEGPVRSAAAPLVGIRRLLPQLELQRERRVLELLDTKEKVVARLRVEHARAREPRPHGQAATAAHPGARDLTSPGIDPSWIVLPTVLRAISIRGYDDAYRALLAMLQATPGLTHIGTELREVALAALGRHPHRDPSSLVVHLEPNIRADEGARRIHRALLEVMIANEAGMLADTDTEFLHDFRVAIRRTRSLLSQLKHILPEPLVRHFRAEFAALGDATNRLRDLDVFLLRLDQDADLLEGADLRPLRKSVEKQRARARKQLLATLEAPRYATFKETWRIFLESPGSTVPAPEQASRPLREVVSTRLLRIYRKICKAQRKLGTHSPADHVHAVRLECKKMRYLIDCCRSLYKPSAIATVVRELRRLQNVLGEFNDAEVQEDMLTEASEAMAADGRSTPEILLAMGRLVERLRVSSHASRRKAVKRLRRFTSKKNRKRFKRAFRSRARHEVAPDDHHERDEGAA